MFDLYKKNMSYKPKNQYFNVYLLKLFREFIVKYYLIHFLSLNIIYS